MKVLEKENNWDKKVKVVYDPSLDNLPIPEVAQKKNRRGKRVS